MTKKDELITEYNKKIAGFMGGVYLSNRNSLGINIDEAFSFYKDKNPTGGTDEYSPTIRVEQLHYHCEWSWLMPVVEKIIEEMDGGIRTCGISPENGKFMVRFERCKLIQADTLIEAMYLSVIDFLEAVDF